MDETTDIPVRSETTRREHKLTAGSVRNVHPCTFLTCEICIAQISFLRGTTAIRGGTDTLRTVFSSGETLVKHPFSVSLLQIGEVDPRREKKLTAGSVRNVHPCTFLTCEICIAQISFLRGTTAIHGGSATLSIYCRSGMDAAGYIRSDVSTTSKLAAKSVQGCTLLA